MPRWLNIMTLACLLWIGAGVVWAFGPPEPIHRALHERGLLWPCSFDGGEFSHPCQGWNLRNHPRLISYGIDFLLSGVGMVSLCMFLRLRHWRILRQATGERFVASGESGSDQPNYR
jgi:hypothetical protein